VESLVDGRQVDAQAVNELDNDGHDAPARLTAPTTTDGGLTLQLRRLDWPSAVDLTLLQSSRRCVDSTQSTRATGRFVPTAGPNERWPRWNPFVWGLDGV